MYSVIIPTLWRSNRLKNLLNGLNNNESVNEIILIDNHPSGRNINEEEFSKLKIISSGKNEYVNPSWNKGVRNANSKFIALCNDDINFNVNIFNNIKPKNNELIGLDTSCYELKQDENFILEKIEKRCLGYGCLMFFKKEDYKPIPSNLKIWYGDDYLMDNFEKTLCLKGLLVKTEMSTSSKSPEFYEVIMKDEFFYNKNKNSINLVVITSAINPFDISMYSSEERIDQLVNKTIPSIRKKIPNSHIVVIEGSVLSKEQILKLKNTKIENLLYTDVKDLKKSYGELILLLNFFTSNVFINLTKEKHINTINKISGRYWFTDKFEFEEHDYEDCLIIKKDEKTWSGKGLCETRYYRFPPSCYKQYINALQNIKNKGIEIDLEHSFYENEALPFNKIKKIDKINVEGNVAPNGTFVSD